MLNVIRLATGSTVRIPQEIWEIIQKMSVDLSVKLGRPVKESVVIHILLSKAIERASVLEMVKILED